VLGRDRLREQVRDDTAARTNVTLGYLLDEWLSGHEVEETTRASYRLLINGFIRPTLGATPLAQLCRRGPRPFEQLYAEFRACRRRCHGRSFVEHRTPRPHTCDQRCAAHVCKPLAVSSVRQCHAVLSGALSAAKRWGWIIVNPLDAAQRSRMPAPKPNPPSTTEAAKIANTAWAQDAEWGTFVWLTFITGAHLRNHPCEISLARSARVSTRELVEEDERAVSPARVQEHDLDGIRTPRASALTRWCRTWGNE